MYSSYGQLVRSILVLLNGRCCWRRPAAAALVAGGGRAVLLAAGALGLALLPAVLAPRVNERVWAGKVWLPPAAPLSPAGAVCALCPVARMREHINVYTLALIIITALIKISEQVFQRALDPHLVFLLAAIAGNLAARCAAQ